MADRLHAMLRSHLRPEIEEQRAFYRLAFGFSASFAWSQLIIIT
jgi:hypothetical protein